MTLRLILAGIAGGLIAALLLTLGQHILELPLRRAALELAGLDLPPPNKQMDALILRNIAFSVVVSMLLAAIYVQRAPPPGQVRWREAALWGLAGFVALALLPALSTPPSLSEISPEGRSFWWLAAAAGAVFGLALLAFGRRWRWFGLVPALLPPVLAPESAIEAEDSMLPPGFMLVDLGLDLLFWLALGLGTAWVLRRMSQAVSS